MWKEIWWLQVPNSVKVFMWRACRDILPTKENLFKWKVLEEAMCIFCKQEVESTRHVLWDCLVAMDVWGGCDRKFQKAQFQGTDFRDVWEDLILRCNGDELAFSAILARNIWQRRNLVVHGGGFSHPVVLIQEANSAFQLQLQVSQCDEERVEMGEDNGMARWQPPPRNMFKANWGVGVNPQRQQMGVGVIVRDDHGRVHAAVSKTLDTFQEPVHGESFAALQVVEFCRDLGLQEVIFEGDSLQVINMILDHEESWCRFGQVIADIKTVLGSFQRWEFKHVRRAQNTAAHGLANESVREVIDRVWMEEIPICILDTVFSE
jgi:ribonuclease HI